MMPLKRGYKTISPTSILTCLALALEYAKSSKIPCRLLAIKMSEGISKGFEALDEDPALAIRSTKELLESVLKTVLDMHGAEFGNENIPKLLK